MIPTVEKSWVPLNYRERRVLGVLVEKAKTTPEYYPLTIAAIVTGSNQKSNRDPVTSFDADDVEEILQGLRKKGAVIMVEAGGRVVRWKHTLYDWLKVTKVELAVVAELLLRGAQTEGDLRARASRMEPLADLAALQAVLESLVAKELIVYLTPPGVRRGAVVTHNLYPPNELDREKARQAANPLPADDEIERIARPRAEPAPQPSPDELAAIRSEVAALRDQVRSLADEVKELKLALRLSFAAFARKGAFEPMETPHHDAAEGPISAPAVPFRIISLLSRDGQEPPSGLTDGEASAAWTAASAPWHPALLAQADDLPRLADLTAPPDPQPGDLFLVASGQLASLPGETKDRAEAAGVPIVEGSEARWMTLHALLARSPDPLVPIDPADPVARDFFALGSAHWWLRDLTNAMGHADTLSRSSLLKEATGGARAWRAGDAPRAINHLRAAFELITEARERFYPLDGYVLDLCLLDPATPPDQLANVLEPHTPFTLLAPASAVEAFALREPERAQALRDAITEGWADVIGGAFAEVDEPFLPWSSLAWQFRRGEVTYRRHLDDRNVETLARRRFGLYPQLPQIARRFGLRFALYGALDAGRFPMPVDAKRLWAAPDTTTLEAITRSPIAADRPSEGARLAWRVGKSMRDDPCSTLVLAHWPSPVAPWFEDFRRTAAYSPILSRWVTVNDFFHRSDRPFEDVEPKPDDYAPAYLAQAAARRDPSPILARALHARDRAALDAAQAMQALASALAESEIDPIDPTLEADLETGKPGLAGSIQSVGQAQAGHLARRIAGEGTGGRPGYLILNPVGVARRARVLLPDVSDDLRPEGPLRAAQLTEEGTWAVVDLPPFGFAWVPRDSSGDHPHPPSAVSLRDRTLSNESMSVEVDPTTGGIRGLQAIGEETARIGQQLTIGGLVGPDGKPASPKMRGATFSADYAGPALAQATTTGTLLDPLDGRPLASFRQRLRLWSGRPSLEIDIRLSDLDPAWLAKLAASDPWTHHLACRWAWPDPQSTLRRSALLAPSPTEADRPETAESLDITSRQRRTALLFGGLAHHRRQGKRMLDTLLVAGSESGRDFSLGVALNLEHNFPATLDLLAPAFAVPTDAGPPRSGPVGWLVQVDHKAVAIVGLSFTANGGERESPGLVVELIETAGKAARVRLRAFRDPTRARQLGGHGEHVVDLPVDGDSTLVDLTPHEITRVELSLGTLPTD